MLNSTAKKLIDLYQLEPHFEGGYFKQIYCSEDLITPPTRFEGESRHASTTIHYLLEGKEFSAWHRIKSDETWHYCSGASLNVYFIGEDRKINCIKIGDPLIDGDATYSFCIKHGLWFCSESSDPESYSFVSCTVSPGFDYRDWDLGDRATLKFQYPEHEEMIDKFTRTKQEEKILNQDDIRENHESNLTMSHN